MYLREGRLYAVEDTPPAKPKAGRAGGSFD
jgi:hypothetical protein